MSYKTEFKKLHQKLANNKNYLEEKLEVASNPELKTTTWSHLGSRVA